jgi:hypothetical protein
MEIDFKDMARKICSNEMFIGSTRFFDATQFVEAMHKLAAFGGKVFYENVRHELLLAIKGSQASKFQTFLINDTVLPYIDSMIHAPLIKEPKTIPQPEIPEDLITRQELMKRLNISEPTVIKRGKDGSIPFLRVGRRILYDWAKVKLALDSSKKKR